MKIKQVEKSNTVLIKVYDTDEDCMTTRFAIVKFYDELLETINFLRKKRLEIKEIDKYIFELTSFNNSCYYISECEYWGEKYSSDELIADIENTKIEAEGAVFIEDFENIEDIEGLELLSTDVELMKIKDYGVAFNCTIKHTTVNCSTATITYEMLNLYI